MMRVDCPACGGEGWIDSQRPHPMRTEDGNNDCQSCDGRGWSLQKAIAVIVEEVKKQIIDCDYERGALGLDHEVIAEHCLSSHELDIQHAIAEALGVAIPDSQGNTDNG